MDLNFQYSLILNSNFQQFHFILSLGTVLVVFLGILFFQDLLLPFQLFLSTLVSSISSYHLIVSFIGIVLTFTPMHFLGFNVMPRRIPDYPDYLNSWNYMSSIGSGITLISFFILQLPSYGRTVR